MLGRIRLGGPPRGEAAGPRLQLMRVRSGGFCQGASLVLLSFFSFL